MKKWLKGGLIGLVVGILGALTFFLFGAKALLPVYPIYLVLKLLILPLSLLCNSVRFLCIPLFFLPIILSYVITGFILGAIIGGIVGKIKYRESFGWGTWPYWFKGGIVGLVAGILYILLRILLAKLRIIVQFHIDSRFIFGLFEFILLSIVVGWIVGKYKKK